MPCYVQTYESIWDLCVETFSFRIGVENIEMKQWRKKFWLAFIPHQNLESSDPCQIPNNFLKIGIVPLTLPWIQKRNVLFGDHLDIFFGGSEKKKIFQDCPKLNSFLPLTYAIKCSILSK